MSAIGGAGRSKRVAACKAMITVFLNQYMEVIVFGKATDISRLRSKRRCLATVAMSRGFD